MSNDWYIKQAFWDYNFTEQQLLQKLSNPRLNKFGVILCLCGKNMKKPLTKLQEEVLKNFFKQNPKKYEVN